MARDALRTGGHWVASSHEMQSWNTFRSATGPYTSGSLVEWGSITKGLVGTAAAVLMDTSAPVTDYLPEYPDATYSVRDLIEHTAGLPRLPPDLPVRAFGDPYGQTVGIPIAPGDAVSLSPRGEYVYSNLGYALLGSALDRVHGSWFEAVRRTVLEPAGIGSATVHPAPEERVMPALLFGRTITPWQMTGSPYAAAGGVWSTFDDLCRYAGWALEPDADATRTVSWQREGNTVWINGEVRAAGAAIVAAGGVTAVAHALSQPPHAADRIATALIERRIGERDRGGN